MVPAHACSSLIFAVDCYDARNSNFISLIFQVTNMPNALDDIQEFATGCPSDDEHCGSERLSFEEECHEANYTLSASSRSPEPSSEADVEPEDPTCDQAELMPSSVRLDASESPQTADSLDSHLTTIYVSLRSAADSKVSGTSVTINLS